MHNYSPAFYENIRDGARRSAEVIIPLALEATGARSIADVGCGQGEWLAVAQKLGISDFAGMDGPYVEMSSLAIPRERFRSVDLEQPLRCERQFDLAMSLEVAEHIAGTCADVFVRSLTSLAPVVLFSAAIPDQGGTNHINEQWPSYWSEKFLESGYLCADCLRPRIWTSPGVMWWYAQNAMFFVRKSDLHRYPTLAPHATDQPPAPLVHPGNYAAKVAQLGSMKRKWKNRGLRGLLARMSGSRASH